MYKSNLDLDYSISVAGTAGAYRGTGTMAVAVINDDAEDTVSLKVREVFILVSVSYVQYYHGTLPYR